MAAIEQGSGAGQGSGNQCFSDRRSFLKGSAALTASFSALFGALSLPETTEASDSNLNILGPRPGWRRMLCLPATCSPSCSCFSTNSLGRDQVRDREELSLRFLLGYFG